MHTNKGNVDGWMKVTYAQEGESFLSLAPRINQTYMLQYLGVGAIKVLSLKNKRKRNLWRIK